jgi:hypothetical protein
MCRISRNSGLLSLVEYSGSLQACTGIALPLTFYVDGQREKRRIQSEGDKRCSSYSCISKLMLAKLEMTECAVNIVRLGDNGKLTKGSFSIDEGKNPLR